MGNENNWENIFKGLLMCSFQGLNGLPLCQQLNIKQRLQVNIVGFVLTFDLTKKYF